MASVRRLKDELFRAPSGSRSYWIPLAFGLLAVTLALGGLVTGSGGGLLGIDPGFVFLGVAFASMGAAELVPYDRRRVAGALRACMYAGFVLYAAFVVVVDLPDLLEADWEVQIIILVFMAFIVGYVWILRGAGRD